MEQIDKRYLVQQNKVNETDNKKAVFAKVMRSKEGRFEGVSFIKNKEKATVMTIADANEVMAWASSKKANAHEYLTKIICVGQ
ncbi:MAG TPA: hypothetical protein VGP06_01880 [Janthinobacterium sp.]|jgi:cytoplasmic iron level regulating protein YaaA (DUF328/UPF0246 family)|nr:hypothetical protein [Janthinobacterium sp.]